MKKKRCGAAAQETHTNAVGLLLALNHARALHAPLCTAPLCVALVALAARLVLPRGWWQRGWRRLLRLCLPLLLPLRLAIGGGPASTVRAQQAWNEEGIAPGR